MKQRIELIVLIVLIAVLITVAVFVFGSPKRHIVAKPRAQAHPVEHLRA